ncbi:MAG: hypothetical protein K940chlam8_01217 [Chlamydiae bacterium]|nr:hypothetical protein [Chlamydiota bacterium]
MTTIITQFAWVCHYVCQNAKKLTNALTFNAFALIQQSSAPPRIVSEVTEDDWIDLGKDSDSDVPEIDFGVGKVTCPATCYLEEGPGYCVHALYSQEVISDPNSENPNFDLPDEALPEIDLETLKIILPHQKP